MRVALRHSRRADAQGSRTEFVNGPLCIDYERRIAYFGEEAEPSHSAKHFYQTNQTSRHPSVWTFESLNLTEPH